MQKRVAVAVVSIVLATGCAHMRRTFNDPSVKDVDVNVSTYQDVSVGEEPAHVHGEKRIRWTAPVGYAFPEDGIEWLSKESLDVFHCKREDARTFGCDIVKAASRKKKHEYNVNLTNDRGIRLTSADPFVWIH